MLPGKDNNFLNLRGVKPIMKLKYAGHEILLAWRGYGLIIEKNPK